ncbi:MAG TPA: hypothetical protein IAA06_11015 [Candidatus Blautia faecavium]|uniref:Uncharacterized protein n=1 Tax=Candidatus Blautia faecavium TaxID=2838487 RepID=A0A9D2RWJ3_9FIRM|nr:hypothetical protein [Candidatus Blautia faecavium]
MDQDWKNNPKLAGLDQNKLRMLQNLADQGSQKSASDMLPFLLSAANQGKNNGLRFSSEEVSLILEVLKMGKSPEETAKLDRIVNMMRMIQ